MTEIKQEFICTLHKYVAEEYDETLKDSGKVTTEPGVEIYYEVHGEGQEKLLLVMGLGSTGAVWLPNVKYLLERNENLQICIIDNRGMGRSSKPSGRYKTTMMALDAIKVLDHLKWDKFHVTGISMGGMISQEIALAALDRVLTLNLSVTHSGGKGSFPPWEGIKGILASNGKTVEQKTPITMGMLYPKTFMDAKTDDDRTFGEIVTNLFLTNGQKFPQDPKGFRSQTLAVQTHSVGNARLEMIKKSGIPILISTGDVDHLVNPAASFFLKSKLDPIEFIQWQNCGHATFYQMFDEFNDAILRHIERRTFASLQDSNNNDIDAE